MADETIQPTNLIKAIVAGAAGWLIPGAGHVCIGRPVRGIIIFLVIGATFWAGMGIGGVMTMDPAADRWWSMAEMLTGAHGIVATARQQKVYDNIYAEHPELAGGGLTQEKRMLLDTALAERGVALVYPANVIARAYAGVAGLLNLLCVFDAVVLALMGTPGDGKRKLPVLTRRSGDTESEVAA